MANELDPRSLKGLSEQEAAQRLQSEGYNELPSAGPRSIWTIALEVVREPMFLLLLACGGIYLAVGDMQEALILLSFVFVIMGITFFQERKTERALEALRDLSSPRALVIRDGKEHRIAGREVVRGDLVVLSEGDRVPADGALLSAISLSVDESLLTGESVPVRKAAWDGKSAMGRPGGDDQPAVYSGTLVVRGQGVAEIRATGAATEIGKIGRSLKEVEQERTPLQTEVGRLVKNLALVGLALCAMVIVAYGLTRGDWLHGLLAGLTLAMAMVPEEFPVVLTVFLALGAWRISQRRVLTRRVPTVETLGAATVLCVDKTGTLTQNRMTIARFHVGHQTYDLAAHADQPLPEEYHAIAEYGILASQKDPFDPMEVAFKDVGSHYLADTEHLHVDWSLVREYPLSPELLAISHVWRSPDGHDYVIAVKGAPEAVVDLCHLTERQAVEIAAQTAQMADAGLRVLGVARARFHLDQELPDEQHAFDFEFIGLVGLADPIRPTVPAAVAECYRAHVRVVMITGDYAGTAQAIAREIGLRPNDKVLTGPEMEQMSGAQLQEAVKGVNLFARVVPEQKLRLVNALKANGEVVAMTGDGVNDAPALKSAHIGIAMGGRGTDVAREAASLVLLDDDFSSIVQAVRMGRRIFDNLKDAMAYILAVHVPIAGMSLLPVLLKLPLALMPTHVVFLEMIIDPACTVVFEAEPEEEGVMERPPRNPSEPLFGSKLIGLSLLQGLGVLVASLAVFAVALKGGRGEASARALSFTTLIVANLGLILTNRSWHQSTLATLKRKNTALLWVLAGALAFLVLALTVPFLQQLFRFGPFEPLATLTAAGVGLVSLLWFEVVKWLRRRQAA